jgi:eukaryotic-like serine/threonine-protein kinase
MKECQLCKNCYTDDVATCPKDGMPTMHTLAGEPVLEGKYNLDCRLGQGGMGVVYKARHAYLKTQLAIKIILPDLVGNDPQLVTRFRQEALAAAAIRHQNVVSVTDYGVINGAIPFLVMEYVEGESLHDLLAREKRLSPEKALEVISAICAGVGAAHHQGIVHRDLKPLNIMICSDKPNVSQAVKILDFGLAKIKSGELLGSFIQAQTTGLMGSPYYMAPEQWADDEPDSRSDIYSLGVMLYQMLAGDVPFKGSSIPAIMKKHISDPAPTFAELGVELSPQIEQAVRNTLQKEKEQRTPTVERMIEELKEAVYPSAIGIHTTSGPALPVSSLNILTNPPRSFVYVDNVGVGESRDDGWITLNGVQSGNHRLRIVREGFPEWNGDIYCDGKPQQIVADLTAPPANQGELAATIASGASFGNITPHKLSSTHGNAQQSTIVQNWDTGRQSIGVQSRPPSRSFLSPLVLGAIALFGLLMLGGVGYGLVRYFGLLPTTDLGNTANKVTPTPSGSPVEVTKADMVLIPGGAFTMGRNDADDPAETPEHQETVGPFYMDKTEVTNAEYYAFVKDMNYKDIPAHWENGKPLPGQENMPVRYVDVNDVNAFIKWRSARDNVQYRLPTEQEWEFAARNGNKKSLYPWGDRFDPKCAVIDQERNDPKPVATTPCTNDWGVHDLIGNVWEWTSSPPWLYPGNSGEITPSKEQRFMIRGGSALFKSTGKGAITSTSRSDKGIATTRAAALGFRLVRPQ